VGLASSDPFGGVKPLCTLPNEGDLCKLSRQVLEYAQRDGVCEVLVGLPLDSSGAMSYQLRNFNGKLCLDFSAVLSAVAGVEMPKIKVLLVDERYTTKEARVRLKSEKSKASIDAMAAACLLERYLEDKGERSMAAKPCPYPVPRALQAFNYDVVREYIRKEHFSSPESELQQKMKRMQLLKEGVVKKMHVYTSREEEVDEDDDDEEEDDVDIDDDDDNEDDDEEFGELASQLEARTVAAEEEEEDEAETARQEELEMDLEVVEEEEEEEDEDLAEQLRIRAARRKRGTLKKKKQVP